MHYPDDDFSKRSHPVYEHLHVEKPDAKTMVSVDFVKSGDLWEIHWNNTPVEMAILKPKLATYLQEKMMTSAYQAQPYRHPLPASAHP